MVASVSRIRLARGGCHEHNYGYNEDRMMIQLYSEPYTLLGDVSANRHSWRRAWLLSGLTALAVPAVLGAVAALGGRPWAILIGYALLAIVPLMLGVSIVVPTTGHARLWLLSLFAPPALLTALL